MSEHVREMYEYHFWANQRILEHLASLSPRYYHQEIESVFPSVAKVLSHIYLTDCMWLSILNGEDMAEALESSRERGTQLEGIELEQLAEKYRLLGDEYLSFIQDQKDLEEIFVLNNPYTSIRETRISEIILHVVNHGTYHRGNISAMLHQMGEASVMTDYAFFWYEEEASSQQ
ncbi:DinB family protein [Halobacillus salinarum]|uniref:DinB family protein n=1 Tax=Halobacillus salinarum TaxID=2932257 RepID=A0ABY4EUY1_9BACI|nr:DinB family protein [Halobacillus salinarum]UOQ45956.1 DinB family protein [Halobacillus salinarum]